MIVDYFKEKRILLLHPDNHLASTLILILLKSRALVTLLQHKKQNDNPHILEKPVFKLLSPQQKSRLVFVDQQNQAKLAQIQVTIDCKSLCFGDNSPTDSFYNWPINIRQLVRESLIVQLIYPYHLPPGLIEQEISESLEISDRQIRLKLSQDNCQAWVDIALQKALQYNSIIIRHPVLSACLRYPFKGYVEGTDRLNKIYELIGLGVVRNLNAERDTIIDQAPADLLALFVLSLVMLKKEKSVDIYNYSTCARNPLRLGKLVDVLNRYYKQHPLANNFKAVGITNNKKIFQIKNATTRLIPYISMKMGSTLNIQKLKVEGGAEYSKLKKGSEVVDEYSQFMRGGWLLTTNKMQDSLKALQDKGVSNLDFDVQKIDWQHYIRNAIYGYRSYVKKEKLQAPSSNGQSNLIPLQKAYLSDFYFAITQGVDHRPPHKSVFLKQVMESHLVKIAIKKQIQLRKSKINSIPVPDQQFQKELNQVGVKLCQQMFSTYNMKALRLFAWSLQKIFSKIYQKVSVNKESFRRLKDLQTKGNLIFIPSHRSYVDFLIVSFILFSEGIKCPYIAAAQDFLGMALVHILLRASGAFFIKRKGLQYPNLYKAILNQYVTSILSSGNDLLFFIEGTRSRTGKTLAPKFGVLNIVCQAVQQQRIKDAVLVPMSINYERVLEGQTFPYQLLGQEKVKQTLGRLIRASEVVLDNYGRIFIEVCQPILYSEFKKGNQGMPTKLLVQSLGIKIANQINDNIVVMSTALVSSVILSQRRGIRETVLNQSVNWLAKYIAKKGKKIGGGYADSPTIAIGDSLKHLEGIVLKSKRNIFELQFQADQTLYKNLLMLGYYRNTISHYFFKEGIISLVVLTSSPRQRLTAEQLFQKASHLYKVFQNQYMQSQPFSQQLFHVKIRQLEEFKVLSHKQAALPNQYCYLMANFVWPLVESYWLTFFFMNRMWKGEKDGLVGQIQWLGQSFYQERKLQFLQCLDMNIIGRALKAFESKRTSEQELRSLLRQNWEQSYQGKL